MVKLPYYKGSWKPKSRNTSTRHEFTLSPGNISAALTVSP